MSHRGSLLCLPDGIWPSPVTTPQEIDESALALVFAAEPRIDHCLIGTGATMAHPEATGVRGSPTRASGSRP